MATIRSLSLRFQTLPLCVMRFPLTLVCYEISNGQVLAVGVANIVAGFLGGFPATATLSMTPLNIKSGAKSRQSSPEPLT